MANTLFPPIVDSWMPAFVGECNIYFTLSQYNSLSSIAGIQLSIRNSKSNKNVLADIYTAEVKNISKDNIKQDGDKYYITLVSSDIKNGFIVDQFYKIQMRFIDASVGAIEDAPRVDWLNLYQQAFSEWSRVCLVKPISEPSLSLFGLEENNEVVLQSALTSLSGTLKFSIADEDEYLKQYRITIYENNNIVPYYQSDMIEAEDYNLNFINYIVPVDLQNKEVYKIKVTIYTNNGYSKTFEYEASLDIRTAGDLEFRAEVTAHPENGSVLVTVTPGSKDSAELQGTRLLIRRSSSETNFKIWEDMYGKMGAIKWSDFTIKSGECYRYQIQSVNAQGSREGAIIAVNTQPLSALDKNTIKVEFDDTYILDSSLQIRVKYDPEVSNFKHVVMESKTDTIGSKYPFIKRNGYVDYRSFSISGLISYESDEKGEFIAKKDLFNSGVIDFYDSVIDEGAWQTSVGFFSPALESLKSDDSAMGHSDELDVKGDIGIGKHGDYIYEREFREKVIEFLYNSKVKLFRSLTEGNILIKLMDISLTPNKTLGRMVYSFSATAHEVDTANISKYLEYNLLSIPDMTELKVEETIGVVGQLYGLYSGDLFTSLGSKYEYYNINPTSTSIYKVESLGWMRIAFYSDAYAIYSMNGIATPVLNTSVVDEKDILYGHIVYVNGNAIYLKTGEELELPYIDKSITSVSLPRGRNEEIIFDYQVNLYQETKSSESNIKSKTYESRVGQLYETFEEEVSYYAKIYNKYKVNKTTWYQKMFKITNLRLQIPANIEIYYRLYNTEIGTGVKYSPWMGPIISGTTQNKYSDPKTQTVLNLWYSEDGATINFKSNAIKDIKFKRRESTPQTDFTKKAIDVYGNEYYIIDVDKYYIVPESEGGVWNDEVTPVELSVKQADGSFKVQTLYVHIAGENKTYYLELPSTPRNIETLTALQDIYEPILVEDPVTKQEVPLLDKTNGVPMMSFKMKRPLLSPHENYVYTINGEYYIYHEGEWYPFDLDTCIILSKIDGLIDYTIDLERGIYL